MKNKKIVGGIIAVVVIVFGVYLFLPESADSLLDDLEKEIDAFEAYCEKTIEELEAVDKNSPVKLAAKLKTVEKKSDSQFEGIQEIAEKLQDVKDDLDEEQTERAMELMLRLTRISSIFQLKMAALPYR